MAALIDLTGQRFNRLIVIKRSYPNSKYGNARWLCRCECGGKKIVVGSDLKTGHTQSCGCIRKLKFGLSNMHEVIKGYKRHAKERGLKWDLTEERFANLTQRNCHYCGALPNQLSKNPQCNGNYIYNGLDRIDNKKGYTIDNVVPCCKICNYAKQKMTLQEFEDWVKKVYKEMFKKEMI